MSSDFLLQAIEIARASVGRGGGPFGALVVRAGRALGSGANEVVSARDPTAHAEINALRAAARALGTHDLQGCEIFASAEPCPMCWGAIRWARLARVTYAATRADAAQAGFDDEMLYLELARPPAERGIVTRHEPRPEALEVFRAWLAKPDRVPY